MARRPRIEMNGFYHVVNRGVEQRSVFLNDEDYNGFEELMCHYASAHGIVVHNYCLMDNHYHLLLEVTRNELSRYMRQLNMNYAIYFNKKYNRVGHLWQGRYKSWYVTDEAYLHTVALYIEQSPVKAGIVRYPEEYPHNSAYRLVHRSESHCLDNSWVFEYCKQKVERIRTFLHSAVDTQQLKEMRNSASLVDAPDMERKPDPERLKGALRSVRDKKERNRVIVEAYAQGYSQHQIAKMVGISQQAVCGIIKRNRSSGSPGINA